MLVAVFGRDWATIKTSAGTIAIEDPRDHVHMEIQAALDRRVPIVLVASPPDAAADLSGLPAELRTLRELDPLPLSTSEWFTEMKSVGEAIEHAIAWPRLGPGVFLSYRRSDSWAAADRLAESLTERFGPGSVFLDVDSIAPGQNWAQRLDERLAASGAVLAVIGPGWLDAKENWKRRLRRPDDHVRRELERALERDVPLIPILVGGASMPRPAELPSSLAQLCERQAVTIGRQSWRYDVSKLAEQLEELL